MYGRSKNSDSLFSFSIPPGYQRTRQDVLRAVRTPSIMLSCGTDLVGLSGLLTNAYDAMRKTIDLLRDQGYQGPIVIGGGQLSEKVGHYVGANHWSTDAVTGVEQCQRLISGYMGEGEA